MRYGEIYFLEVEHVEQLHMDAIAIGGGDPTVRDPRLVQSAVMAPRHGYYNSLAAIAAGYAYGIAKNHGYTDGNKRTALEALVMFLDMNGFPVTPGPEWADILEDVTRGALGRDELIARVVRLMGSDVPIGP